MAGNNPSYLQTVYVKAEELFSSIKNLTSKYLEWTALAKIDFRTYIQENFKSVDDWECNFQMIKQKRIELKRLDDKEKLDCINVSLVRFKGGIEDIFKELSDELVRTLHSSTESEAEEVLNFVRSAQEKLSVNPKSIDEIEAMNKDAMEIGEKKAAI
jgi:hypothetical protein